MKTKLSRILYGLTAALVAVSMTPTISSAASISPRKVVIGSSVADTSTTYAFTFTTPTSTIVKSASFAACTTASGACTPVPGFSSSSSTLSSQPVNLGDASGWTVNTGTANELRILNSGNATTPSGSQSVSFSNVHNPSATNSTFYIRITTFSDASWTTPIDNGAVASSTAGQVLVTVVIDESLTFTLANSTVDITKPSTVTTGIGTSTMTVSTNAATGYTLGYSGSTLTSGGNTITAMTTQGASVPNSKQFGLNLVSNTAPTVGSNVSGSGSGIAATGYNTTNQYKFNPAGDVVASAALPTNDNTFTTSYIVNMNGSTAAGAYSTLLTYTVTSNF